MLKRVYNFTLEELATTPRNILALFYEEMPRVLASEQMMLIQSVAVPHMDEKDRKQVIKDLQARLEAGVREGEIERPKTQEELAEEVQKMGFGFVVE